ncbi:MAG: hypothetical protein ACREOV_08270, partial [Candidatus Dormibacteraceae bacterium]
MPEVILGVTEMAIVAGPLVALIGLALVLRPQERPWGPATAALGVLVAWYAVVHVLISAGAFQTPVAGTLPSVLLVTIPLVAGVLVVCLAPSVRRLVSERGIPAGLVGLQSYRVVGGAFLVLFAMHRMPVLFALPAGVGDLLIGISAWPVAAALREGRLSRVVIWNVLGLLDLVLGVGLGVAASPALHLSPDGVTTQALTTMPVALVPTFLVPVSILLHV